MPVSSECTMSYIGNKETIACSICTCIEHQIFICKLNVNECRVTSKTKNKNEKKTQRKREHTTTENIVFLWHKEQCEFVTKTRHRTTTTTIWYEQNIHCTFFYRVAHEWRGQKCYFLEEFRFSRDQTPSFWGYIILPVFFFVIWGWGSPLEFSRLSEGRKSFSMRKKICERLERHPLHPEIHLLPPFPSKPRNAQLNPHNLSKHRFRPAGGSAPAQKLYFSLCSAITAPPDNHTLYCRYTVGKQKTTQRTKKQQQQKYIPKTLKHANATDRSRNSTFIRCFAINE